VCRSLIIGYGNPLRSDDGFGWKLATALQEHIPSEAKVIAAQQLTPELGETIARHDRILFLDASHEGRPGEIRFEPVRRDPGFQFGVMAHHLSPPALLELSYRHFGAEPEAALLTVTGENFELGEKFSPVLQNAWKPCLERVLKWVRAL